MSNSIKETIPFKYFKQITEIKKSFNLSDQLTESHSDQFRDKEFHINQINATITDCPHEQKQPYIADGQIKNLQKQKQMPLVLNAQDLQSIMQQKYIPIKSLKKSTITTPLNSQNTYLDQNNFNLNNNKPDHSFNQIEYAKKETNDVKIEISIKAQRSMAKLKEAQTLPAMISLKTEGGSRTNVDLICVIDVSGSMSGEKIGLVKSTMKYLLEVLTPSDRLSIVTFETWGQIIFGLTSVKQQNKDIFNRHIQTLSGRGGTDICSGLDLALKIINERKQPNDVTSIFLLSDGQDRGADHKFKQTLLKQEENLGNFSIHSFGFGTDHDENLMTNICKLRDGNFYFIKELETLDEAFCNALGGIISLAAKDVEIKLLNISQKLAKGTSISKTYGDMWQMINQNDYRIKIMQLMSGVTKDYVFEIDIPKINSQIGDLNRDHQILLGYFKGTTVNGKIISGQCSFKLTFLNDSEQIPEVNENIDVIENHLRVLASESIKENMSKADQNKFDEAQKGIDVMIAQIRGSKKARKEKMKNLLQDLERIKQKCASKKAYLEEGKKWMTSATITHSKQSCFSYSSSLQAQMVEARATSKKMTSL